MTTLTGEWRTCAQDDFVVGDRIQFTSEETDLRTEGTVSFTNWTDLHVDRDDGAGGGGPAGSWLTTEVDNGPLMKWVEAAPMEWVTVDHVSAFTIGDRIQFTCDRGMTREAGRQVEGEVVAADGVIISVKRDDGFTGGGITIMGYGGTWIIHRGGDRYAPLKKWQAPLDPGRPSPERAVFCDCCGLPTGERVKEGDRPTYRFCTDCRDLPAPWAGYDEGTDSDGIVNDEAGERRDDMGARGDRHGRLRRMRGEDHPTTPTIPTYDDPPTADPGYLVDDERVGITCPGCGGGEFTLRGVTEQRFIYYNTIEGADHEPGDTLRFYEYDTEYDTQDDAGANVECTECGRAQEFEWETE